MIPLATVGRTKKRPYMTFALLSINVIVFFIEYIISTSGTSALQHFFASYAYNSCSIGTESILFIGRNALFSMFLHGNVAHLLGNMLFLWLFGPKVELYLGHKPFLAFYLIVGFAASISQSLLGGAVCSPLTPYAGLMIGASGAIAGIMGAYLWLYPGSKIDLALFYLIRVRWPAFIYLFIYIIRDIFNALDPNRITQVAYWAHIGGFICGLIIIFFMTMVKPVPKNNPFD
ncbi:rhomboid family intramembrane serine protease [Anaerolineales bacterium]